MSKEKRLALVTGATDAAGIAIARRLAADGFSVLVADIDAGAARRSAEEAGDAEPLALDVGDERAVTEAYAAIAARHGRLDVLINHARHAGPGLPLERMSVAEWEAVVRTDLTGVFLMCRGAVPLMRRHAWGRIVNVTGAGRGPGQRNISATIASQNGVIGFSRGLANENGRHGITVNCVAPSGLASTAQHLQPGLVGRAAEGSDAAHAVAWLCSEASSFVTGIVVDVNGGASMP